MLRCRICKEYKEESAFAKSSYHKRGYQYHCKACRASSTHYMLNKVSTCRGCSKQFTPANNSAGIYCSNACQGKVTKENSIERWLKGEDQGWTGDRVMLKAYIRDYLLEKANYACSQCGWDKRHPDDNRPLVEVDHIDGDAYNCKNDNLRVLCPNCHSMTSTYKRRNIGGSRFANIAQPEERLSCKEDVTGSIPVVSTN